VIASSYRSLLSDYIQNNSNLTLNPAILTHYSNSPQSKLHTWEREQSHY